MATFNGCDRILKADVCLVKLYLKLWITNYPTIRSHPLKFAILFVHSIYFYFYKTHANIFPSIYKDLIFYIFNVCLPFYILQQN